MIFSPPLATSSLRLAALASIAFALPLLTGAGGATAQEDDALFDDVILLDTLVVTSTKRAVDPFQVNGAIEVATPDELFDRDFLTVDKLDRVFADVNIRNRSSRAYANVTIRGQSSNDFYNPTAQLYVDGLPQDQTILTQLLPQGLEQVELLYGPQGTLYGRGAVGGVFNIVTRKPDEVFRVSASGSVGNLDRSGAFLINVPLIADSLFMDAAVAGLRELGEYKDVATGEDFGNTSNWNGRARLRYAPAGSPLDIMLMASHDDLESDEEQYVSAANFDTRIAFPAPSSYTLATDSYGATVSYDFGFAGLTSLTGYQDRLLDRTIFGSYMPESQTTLSQELRLATDPQDGRAIDYVVGLYAQRLDFERTVAAFSQTSKQVIDSYAAFGELTWHVTDRFDVTPGLRFDYETADATAIGMTALTDSGNWNALSPKLAFGYDLTQDWRAYALYSTGFKAGGFTRIVTPANIGFTYDPQHTHNFEIGTKLRALDEAVEFTAAAYYNITDDYQLFVGLQPFQYLQNVGEVEARGVDLTLKARPTDRLSITGALGLNRTTFEKYANPAMPGLDFTGNTVPYAPPVTGNLSAKYTFDLPDTLGRLAVHGGVSYIGEIYFDDSNTIGQGAYALFDAGLVWEASETFSVDLYVDNIADETYATYGFDGGSFLGVLYQLGQGRSFGGRLNVVF